MTKHLHVFPRDTSDATESLSPEWTVVEGAPVPKVKASYFGYDRTMLSGFWESSEGTYRVSYANWEFCNMLTGRCTITQDGGEPVELTAGSVFIVEPGFTGTWQVHEAMSKNFVFRFAQPRPE